MIEVIKNICGNPPSLQTITVKTCDECGGRCAGSFKTQKLFAYDGKELCAECLLDELCYDGTIETIE